RPVILSRPAKLATGLAMGCAMAGLQNTSAAAVSSGLASHVSMEGAPGRKAPRSSFRRPGAVVTDHALAFALVEQAAIGAVGRCRAGQIGLMRLFPGLGNIFGLARRHIGAVMHPAMPAIANGGGIGGAGIGDVAPVGLAVLIVFIAEGIAADIVAEAPDPQPCAPSLAAPPGEDFSQELRDTRFGQLS